MKITKRLARIQRDLDTVAHELEERGLQAQSSEIDAAHDKVEDVATAFESL